LQYFSIKKDKFTAKKYLQNLFLNKEKSIFKQKIFNHKIQAKEIKTSSKK
jgi:hypothetical protein